jgi:hypothetical protein
MDSQHHILKKELIADFLSPDCLKVEIANRSFIQIDAGCFQDLARSLHNSMQNQ